MTSLPGFTVDVGQNPYLPTGGRDVSAIVTVTADQSGDEPRPAGDSAEIIIIDHSNSMGMPISKVVQACAATAAAVDVIRDGAWFAIIGGAGSAQRVYPANGMMAVADERTREEAKQAVRKLGLRGGTAMSAWLRLAYQMFQSCPATLRHAILLTDGPNMERRYRRLDVAIEQCEGAFRCDCRGVGTDWQVSELRKISTALLGTVDIVPDPAGLAADFREMMRGAMSKQLPDVLLRVRTPQQATVRFVKQVAPAIDDLTARRVQSGPQAGDYPTGAWAPGETRDYHVGIQVNTPAVGQEMLAARVSLLASSPDGQQVLGQGLIMAERTHDEELSTRIDQRVAHYTGQEELADAIQGGLEASKRGDGETATARLGRAVALAHQAGNEDTARLLAKVVDVVDEATGTVRLKKKVEAADEMALDIRSAKTVRVKKELP
jgi:von Willebrand factor type A C-terminal domain/von Willebrand factor type A domain